MAVAMAHGAWYCPRLVHKLPLISSASHQNLQVIGDKFSDQIQAVCDAGTACRFALSAFSVQQSLLSCQEWQERLKPEEFALSAPAECVGRILTDMSSSGRLASLMPASKHYCCSASILGGREMSYLLGSSQTSDVSNL